MKIINRFTGGTIHEAEAKTTRELVEMTVEKGISLRGADLEGAYLRWANLEGADLEGADLRRADLRRANLEGAYLEGADLEGADLRRADLEGADLEGADLRRADLRGTCVIDIGQRSDGYQFYLHCGLDEPHILAGCRCFTITDARKHWRKTRGGTPLGKESLRMVSDGVARAKIRGLI